MYLTKGIIRADIIAAGQAIQYFEEKQIRDIKNIAAYHLQQAAEKLIKIQIYKSQGQNINSRQMYTHNLDRLILYGESLGINLIVPDYIRQYSARITDWEAGSRYDTGVSVRIDTLKRIHQEMVTWEKQVQA